MNSLRVYFFFISHSTWMNFAALLLTLSQVSLAIVNKIVRVHVCTVCGMSLRPQQCNNWKVNVNRSLSLSVFLWIRCSSGRSLESHVNWIGGGGAEEATQRTVASMVTVVENETKGFLLLNLWAERVKVCLQCNYSFDGETCRNRLSRGYYFAMSVSRSSLVSFKIRSNWIEFAKGGGNRRADH